jgi:hypothetical protein
LQCRYKTEMRLFDEHLRAKFCTLSPTHPFKNTHSKGKGEHPERGAHRHTYQQVCTPQTKGQEINPG